MQRTEHIELAVHEQVGKNLIEAGIFQDTISDAAVSRPSCRTTMLVGRLQVLPDLFSRASTINGGRHFTRGYRVSYAQSARRSPRSRAGVRQQRRAERCRATGRCCTETVLGGVRDSLAMQRANIVTASLSTTLPGGRDSQIVSGYQWVSRPSAIAADMYNEFAASSDPGWNILVRQPLPFGAGTRQARADRRPA